MDEVKVVFICDTYKFADNGFLFRNKLLGDSYGIVLEHNVIYDRWKKEGVLIVENSKDLRDFLRVLQKKESGLIYVLMGWGSHKYAIDIDKNGGNVVLLCMDPYDEKEYVGKKVLKRINNILMENGNSIIKWYGK